MLEVDSVRFTYPNGQQVIEGVTFSIPKGKRVAFFGGNGSGKTTLARLMSGLLKPTGGRVMVDGIDTAVSESIYEVRRKVGMVFQDPEDQIVEAIVEREIAFGPRNLGLDLSEVAERVERSLDLFGIQHLRRRSSHLLSAGEKQIVAVASIFSMQPDYVILDECTSLVDSRSRQNLISAVERLLAETGAGLAFITMRLEDIWICDEVLALEGGLIEFRGPKDDFVGHLKSQGLPFYGTSLLVSEIDDSIPGFMSRLAACKSLSGGCLADALAGFCGDREGERSCQ